MHTRMPQGKCNEAAPATANITTTTTANMLAYTLASNNCNKVQTRTTKTIPNSANNKCNNEIHRCKQMPHRSSSCRCCSRCNPFTNKQQVVDVSISLNSANSTETTTATISPIVGILLVRMRMWSCLHVCICVSVLWSDWVHSNEWTKRWMLCVAAVLKDGRGYVSAAMCVYVKLVLNL